MIHGRDLGSNTSGKPRKQRSEWMQRLGFHTMVTSPFEYVLVLDADVDIRYGF